MPLATTLNSSVSGEKAAKDIAAHHYSETADIQRQRASLDESITQGVSKVLVIYTGGTIGMKHDSVNGYSPVKGYLPEELRSIGRFHDPNGFNDFDIEFHRSSDVNNLTGKPLNLGTPPGSITTTGAQVKQNRHMDPSTLIEMAKQRLNDMAKGNSRNGSAVTSPSLLPKQEFSGIEGKVSVNGSTASSLLHAKEEAECATDSLDGLAISVSGKTTDSNNRTNKGKPFLTNLHPDNAEEDVAESGDLSNDERGAGTPTRLSEWLITPRSMYGRRVQYCFLEYDPLLDSCNMNMADWVRIVSDIEQFYYTFDAFIILHGTDTMAYTASALSFMLHSLGKSVIVTGSQVPIAEVRNDGIENFLGALTIAGHFVIPEVSLYFNNKLFRGNRCIKIDATDFEAFSSPNLAPLVKVGVDIEVNWPEVHRPNAIEPFCAYKQMESNVATLRLFPGISAHVVRAFLSPPIRGVVLETYGAGNAPDAHPGILKALSEASDRGVVIVNVSQCQRGNVLDLYATARGLTKAKVVPGRDMTSECALTKLSYLLGRGFTPEKCRELLGRSLRGELTVVQMQSRPIFYSGSGKAHSFTQFVSRQILEETQANKNGIEVTLSNANRNVGSQTSPLLRNSSEVAFTDGSMSPPARETVNERVSIYRSFFPVLLCAAAATGDLQGMYLLEAASNNTLEVTSYDYTGQTPLHSAVRAGQLPCARFLLKRGASVHILSRQGHTPLFVATSSRHPEMVTLLLQAGAHFSDAEIRDLMQSMQNAVSRGDIEFVKLAIRAGFDAGASDHEGRTILFFAVINSQVEIVEYLLTLPSVSVEHWDNWGYSPVDYVLRKLDLWNELGAPHEDSLHDMQHICALFSERKTS